jgi:hypothetical protein
MIAYILKNLSTIIVGAVVLGIVAFALVRTILNVRRGGSPCGCGCGNCPGPRGVTGDAKERSKSCLTSGQVPQK